MKQVSQQQSIYNQVSQLTVSLQLWAFVLETNRRSQSSFGVVLKLHEVREHRCDWVRRITRSQETPVDRKIEYVRARLDRLKVDATFMGNEEELKRRGNLYECVFPIHRKKSHMLNWFSELSRESGTSWSFCLNGRVPMKIQERKET